jgi:ABC-type sugar transport system ATPase subunit
MNRRLEGDQSDQIIKDLSVKVNDKVLQTASNLSGGNQQKLVIGKWLLKSPEILIMDEPTRGVDVGAKYEIYSLIQTLAKNGSGVLFISSEMEELIGVCDRIIVVNNGKVSGELSKNEFDQKKIMHYALKEETSNG